MIYLEMARNRAHGGGTWSFSRCIWAPSEKRGGGAWPFWTKVLRVQQGDTVIHLRGIPPKASFVGYSTVSGDGFETSRRPPDPEEWGFAERFYRADLSDFTPFHKPVNLGDLFQLRRDELEAYFEKNRARRASRANIFYVRQSGRLQCLNGAYLSDIDTELLAALFGSEEEIINTAEGGTPIISVETGSQIATVHSRLGQSKFSRELKALYGNGCCFPGCEVTDPRFLVASHIARWSDNERLRGHLGNGLCLCLLHDRAFELGLFTLDEQFRVYVNPRESETESPVVKELFSQNGRQISLAEIVPLDDALLEHWIRVDIEPWNMKKLGASV